MALFSLSASGRPALTTLCGLLLTAVAGAVVAQNPEPPRVSIAAAYTEEIIDEAVFIGRGEAIDEVSIVARVNGFLEETAVANGATVAQGDLLFRIEPDAYLATLEARRADVARAEANLELTTVELERREELFRRGSVPEAERDLARANKLSADADLRAARAAVQQAELDLSYTEIHAPFPGRVGRVGISVGDLVGPNTPPLVTLIRESPMFVAFSLDEKQLVEINQRLAERGERIEPGGRSPDVYIELPNGTELGETGKIVFLDNRIDPGTGAITVRARFDNASGLIFDGGFLSVRIQAVEPVNRTLVPLPALQRDQRGDFVLVVNDQQMVEQRYILTGDQFGTAVIVTEGLQPGEAVIVEGLQRVRPGVPVDPVLVGTAEE